MTNPRTGDAGQALALLAVMLPLFLAVAGLALEGGLVFAARRELQGTADAAARAGAMQLDTRVYRESGGATVVLDEARAREAAAEYLLGRADGLSAVVDATPGRVTVEVSRDVPLAFLRIVGLTSTRISATAPAEPRYGVEQASG